MWMDHWSGWATGDVGPLTDTNKLRAALRQLRREV
jgi:hypothetical protein